MGFIPKDAKWYLADIVQETCVEGDPRNVVHTNMHLVRADSPEEAYHRAMELGAAVESTYKNPQGQNVRSRFRGLRELSVIHDELEHGAELSCRADIHVSEDTIQRWVCSKEELSFFTPTKPKTGPNYLPGDIAELLYEQFPHLKPDGGPTR